MRDVKKHLRRPGDTIQPVIYFAIMVSLFVLGTDAQNDKAAFAPAIVWLSVFLAVLLVSDRSLRDDYSNAIVEQWIMSPVSLTLCLLAKAVAQWICVTLPIVIAAPFAAYALGSSAEVQWVTFVALILGTPSLVLLALFATAITVAVPRAGVLFPVLVLPLAIPVLVFGAGAGVAAQTGISALAPLYFLASISVLSITLLPLLSAGALKNSYL